MRFETGYEVTIQRPVDEVFAALALPDGLERLLRLSPMVTTFTLLGTRPGSRPSTEVIDFEFGERVPVLPGFATDTAMRVEQTVDREVRRVDYRSRTKGGAPIRIHKVRTFEPVGDATRVTEVIHGDAPPGLHWLVRRTARTAHIEHMDSYAGLFQGRGR